MEGEPIWFKYATFDDDGLVNGVRDDAPEEAKQAYADYIAERERDMQNGYITKY